MIDCKFEKLHDIMTEHSLFKRYYLMIAKGLILSKTDSRFGGNACRPRL